MRISIITATFNAGATISDCLESVREQSFADVEHIVIDAASTDGTVDILRDFGFADIAATEVSGGIAGRAPGENLGREFRGHITGTCPRNSRPRSNLYLSEPDSGIYDGMNKGMRLVTGDVVGILNGDDFYHSPEVLARVARVFEDERVDACYGDLVYIAGGKDSLQLSVGSRQPGSFAAGHRGFKVVRYWRSGEFDYKKFYWGWMPPHPTFFVRRSVYEKYGLFNLELGTAADYELMLRFLVRYRVQPAYIPEVLVMMRSGGASNVTLQSRLRANRMDRKAWSVNGLKPHPWTLAMKPLRKVGQWFSKPEILE